MIKYFTFSFSIAFISWIVGMIITALLSGTNFYRNGLASLNFIKNEKVNGLIGLTLFKWIIMHSFFKYFNPKISVTKKILANELGEYRLEMTKAELNHLFAFLFMTIFIVIKLSQSLYLFITLYFFTYNHKQVRLLNVRPLTVR